MPKTYTRLFWLRLLCFLWSLILILWAAAELVLAYDFTHFGADSLTREIYALNIVILGSCILALLVWTLLRLRSWKRFEQRRQAATQGQQSLLALEQPVPNPSALSLPSTIIHHPSRLLFVRGGSIFLVAVVII